MGGNFRAGGGTGAAPTTIWMGLIPDRLNMLWPGQSSVLNTGLANSLLSNANAGFMNLWLTFNASFGAFTTAPDGTTNVAQALVEDTSNNPHCATAFLNTSGGAGAFTGKLRLAGFFKSNGRRIGMRVTDSAYASWAEAIFDLSGGQVGVQTATAGNFSTATASWQVFPAQMIPFPNGWYLCFFDFAMVQNFAGMFAELFLDNGTGTAAESRSYTGNGASGVFGWRTNIMPSQSWGMNNQVFFDDFNDPTLSNWDLNNTLDPTKTWFIQNGFIDFQTNPARNSGVPNPAVPVNHISASGSILTVTSSLFAFTFCSAAQIGTSTSYVGRAFPSPCLIEASIAYTFGVLESEGSILAAPYWTAGIEFLVDYHTNFATSILNYREMDWAETDIYAYHSNIWHGGPQRAGSSYSGASKLAQTGSSVGIPAWDPTLFYNGSVIVSSGGNFYKNIGTNNQNNMPPNASVWQVYNPPPYLFGTVATNLATNLANQNLYSSLVLPWSGGKDLSSLGMYLNFFNNIFVGYIATWGPYQPGNVAAFQSVFTYPHTTDNQHFPIITGAAPATASSTKWDYFRVITQ